MKRAKISFSNYNNLPFGTWCDWKASGKTAINYFTSCNEEDVNTYDLYLIRNWLDFLTYYPQSMHNWNDKVSIWEKSYHQKLDALEMAHRFNDKTVLLLPCLLAIFEQDSKYYNPDSNERLEKKWRRESWSKAYPKAIYWLIQLTNSEKWLKEAFEELKQTDEQKKAGIEKMSIWGKYSTLDMLAGGDVLKQREVIKLTVEEISHKLVFENHKAWYLQKLEEVYREKHDSKFGKKGR